MLATLLAARSSWFALSPIVAAVVAGVAAWLGRRNSHKLDQITVLVDGRLTLALERIEELAGKLDDARAEKAARTGDPPPPPVARERP